MLQLLKWTDTGLFFYINRLPHPGWVNQIFLFFSFYPLIIWLVAGILVVVIEERREPDFIFRLLLALGLAGLIATGIIKPLVRRPRPDLTYGRQVVIVEEKPAVIPAHNDFAFPSGHTAVAFAGYYILTREETGRWRGKKPERIRGNRLRFIFLTFAALTAFSRIYLGKHYPLDVAAGGMFGWMAGWLAWRTIDVFKARLDFLN